MKKSQMTTCGTIPSVDASSTTWRDIKWQKVSVNVHRLQMRIAKAVREQRFSKARALQWLLTHSLEAKLLAVKRVISSQGAKTPGIDGELYQCDSKKMQLALSLKQRGYKAQPLKRVYIPKRNGKRALGIPTLRDRAMQALYLLAVEPVAEMQADSNSYGFRPYRSTADAVERCFKVLCNKHSVQWILEGDIRACFDKISHEWLLLNIPMETRILQQWLKAGFIEKQTLFPTTEGTPQGGIISPVAANMALDGLEEVVKRAAMGKSKYEVHAVRYADDFVIIGATKELLENDIKPAIAEFLAERGLELSLEKTRVTHIEKGFDFLGFNICKYQGKLLIKPSKKSIFTFLGKTRQLIKAHKTVKTCELIGMLNSKIRGWAYYYRHVVAKRAFGYVDDCIYRCLSRWTRRRHPNKNFAWIRKTYFHQRGSYNWIFFGIQEKKDGKKEVIDLHRASRIPIKRHVKIRSEATPYDPDYIDYLVNRKQDRNDKLYHYWQVSALSLFGNKKWVLPRYPARS
jgi:RNA-directed DNA polymerase